MARREVRRWIAAPPANVFDALGSYVVSFAWLGQNRHCLPTAALSVQVGAPVTCPLRRGTCRLCITAAEPAQLLVIDVASAGHIVRVQSSMTPQNDGTLFVCTTECRDVLSTPMPSVVSHIYQGFGRMPSDIKRIVEARQMP